MALQWVAETSLRGPKGEDGGTSPHAARHATGGSDPVTPASIGAALDTDTVHRTGTETISGTKTVPVGAGNTWAFQQPPQIEIGTAADHPVRRDDPRLSDARTPTAHTHTSADVTRTIVSQTSVGNGGTATPAASADIDRFTTSGTSATLATPSGTAVDGAVVNVEVYSTGSTTNLALAGGYTLTGGQASPVAVPSGKVCHLALRYRGIAPAGWRVLAVSVDN